MDSQKRIAHLMQNPNFAKLYRNNRIFRSYADRIMQSDNLLSRVKIDISSEGQIRFNAGAEGLFSSLREAVSASFSGLKTKRSYTSEGGYYTGSYSNRLLQDLSKMNPDVSFNVRTFDTTKESLDSLVQLFGVNDSGQFLGVVVPDQETAILLEAVKNGKKLSQTEIFDLLKINAQNAPAIFKRLKIFTSDRVFSVAQDTPMSMATFDTRKIIEQTSASVKQRAEATAAAAARNEMLAKGLPESEFRTLFQRQLDTVYERMSDGLGYIPQSNIAKEISKIEQEANAWAKKAEKIKNSPHNSPQHIKFLEYKKRSESLSKTANDMRAGLAKGLSFNQRLLGATDVTTNQVTDLFKGDAVTLPQNMAERMAKLIGVSPKADLSTITLFAPKRDMKSEVSIQRGVARAYRTLEAHGFPRMAESNILTLATFQDFFNPENLFETGMQQQIAKGVEEIKKGIIGPQFDEILKQLENWEPSFADGPIAAREAQEAKRFVRRIRALHSRGVRFDAIDSVTNEMYSALTKHVAKFQKGKYGKTVLFEGQQVPYYGMRMPIMGSTSGHILNLDIHNILKNGTARTGTELLANTLYIDQNMGRFGLSGDDISRMSAAFGGSDLDDRLYATLRYDSRTRRLFALTFRDPNSMGEFMLFDADITHDQNVPLAIRELWAEKKSIESKLLRSKTADSKAKAYITRIDDINETLHKYFMGKEVSVLRNKGKKLVSETVAGQTFIKDIDVIKTFNPASRRSMPAPKGFRVTDATMAQYRRGSVLRSMGGTRNISANEYLRRLNIEYARESTATSAGSIFEYMGDYFSAFHQQTGMFYRPQAIVNYEKTAGARTPLTQADILRRLETEMANGGILGRSVNSSSVLESFITSYKKYLSDPMLEKFMELARANPFADIPREMIIDAAVKEGNEAVLQAAQEAITENYRKLGSLIYNLQEYGKSIGDSSAIGIDPIEFQTRVLNDNTGFNALRSGYLQAAGQLDMSLDNLYKNILLSEMDEKAYTSKIFKFFRDTHQEMVLTQREAVQQAAQNMVDQLADFEFSPQETLRAQQFLDEYGKDVRAMAEQYGSLSDMDDLANMMQQMLDSGENVDDFIDGIDNFNNRSLSRLLDMDIFEDLDVADELTGTRWVSATDASERQILAIAKLAAQIKVDNPDGPMALRSLLDLSVLGDESDIQLGSIADLFTSAWQRHVINNQQVADSIAGMTNPQDVFNFMGEFRRQNTLRALTDENRVSIIEKIDSMIDTPEADIGRKELNRLTRIRSGLDQLGAEIPQARPPIAVRRMGQNRYAAREAADVVADAVVQPRTVRETMTKLDSKYIKNLIEKEPIVGKSLAGIGLFAFLGITYRATKDVTPEEAQGPPLLPGGSFYEDYDTTPTPSIYSSVNARTGFGKAGFTYRVDVNGSDYSPEELSTNLAGFTGGNAVTNVYSSLQGHSLRVTAAKKLQELMSGES